MERHLESSIVKKKKSRQHAHICSFSHQICAVHLLCAKHYADKVITTADGVPALQTELPFASLACFVDCIDRFLQPGSEQTTNCLLLSSL